MDSAGELILWDVLEEHLDEASFLWSTWERALLSPGDELEEIAAGPERRLHLHLAGLALGGTAVARRLLEPALDEDEPGRICSASFSLLGLQGEVRLEPLWLRLVEGSPVQQAAIRRGLELGGREELARELLELDEGVIQAAGLDLLAFQGLDPGPILDGFLASEDSQVRASALRAARGAPSRVQPGQVLDALGATAAEVRSAAQELGLMLGLREAREGCREAASAGGQEGGAALLRLALVGGEQDMTLLLEALQDTRRRKDAVWALGFSGRPRAAEACLPLLSEPSVARLAGEAFSAVTGLAIEGDFALPEPEEPDSLLPLEEDLDMDLAPRLEDELPLPDPDLVGAWWREHHARFEPRRRYLGGKPLEVDVLLEGLEHGPARRRHALALELALRSRGEHRVETRAFSSVQRRQMEAARAWRPRRGSLARPLEGSFER